MTTEEKEVSDKIESYRLTSSMQPEVDAPTYEESLSHARFIAGFPDDDIGGDTSLRLIGLICQITIMYRVQHPTLKPLNIIEKAWGGKPDPAQWAIVRMHERLSILCELFITPNAKFSTYGYTSVSDMMKEITRIMDLWLPF